MPCRRPLAICLLAFAGVLPALAADLPDPASPKLKPAERLPALVARVKQEQQALKTLEAHFVQLRESELLLEPEESQGVFAFQAPDSVRWDYESPKPISLVILGDEMTTWYQDLDRADRLNVGRYSGQILRYLGAGSSLDTLLQYFDVTMVSPDSATEPFRLELKPRYERIGKRLREMTIWLDRVHYLPVRLRYLEPNGDRTEYRFSAMRFNEPIAADRFDLKLPPSVAIRAVGAGVQP
jgi:outer membrane lipoprotein-sorting protein